MEVILKFDFFFSNIGICIESLHSWRSMLLIKLYGQSRALLKVINLIKLYRLFIICDVEK